MLKAFTVKFSDGLVPVRQSKQYLKYIGTPETKEKGRLGKHRISVDISKSFLNNSEKKNSINFSEFKVNKIKRNEQVNKNGRAKPK